MKKATKILLIINSVINISLASVLSVIFIMVSPILNLGWISGIFDNISFSSLYIWILVSIFLGLPIASSIVSLKAIKIRSKNLYTANIVLGAISAFIWFILVRIGGFNLLDMLDTFTNSLSLFSFGIIGGILGLIDLKRNDSNHYEVY